MSDLAFLSPNQAAPEAVWRSPLERALRDAPPGITDLSHMGKVEVRGDIGDLQLDGGEAIWITPRRALVICNHDQVAQMREGLQGEFLAVDMTAALAGLEVQGVALMRRLTDLDLDNLPAPGPVAHVQAVVVRDEDEIFRFFFPQEYGDYIAEVVADAAEGLR